MSDQDFSSLLNSLSSIQNILNSYNISENFENKPHPQTSTSEPSAIPTSTLQPANLEKYNFLVYCSKLLSKSKPEIFKPVSVIPCSNKKLPINTELPELTGLYFDKINAIIWVTLDKLKNKSVSGTALDVCQMICLNGKVDFSVSLSILAKDVYKNRERKEFLDVKLIV